MIMSGESGHAGNRRWYRRRPLQVAALLVVWSQAAFPASWDTELANGQQLSVDPTTNRAVIQSDDGRGRPLWDGVHRLRDGSTITVRSGVMVPNEEIEILGRIGPADAVKTEPGQSSTVSPTAADDCCNELVLKTCGLRNTCGQSEPCQLSRQLKALQRQPCDMSQDNPGWAEARCREALDDDEQFSACEQEPPLLTTACQRLLEHVCGAAPRCYGSGSCLAARDLGRLEQAALDRQAPGEVEMVRQRCLKVLGEHAFFPPCR
jgi:hypothetical protein